MPDQPQTPPQPPAGGLLHWSAVARAMASNRLVQFVVIGGAMFALAPAAERRDVVSVDSSTVAELAKADTTGEAARLATGTADEAPDAIQRRLIEDEVLYREGVKLGFDKDDGIVRQRVVQKVLYLAEELGGGSGLPAEKDLRAFHAANPERFRRPQRLRFRHIFARDKTSLPQAPADDSSRGGQLSPVGPELDASLPEIEQALGGPFASAVSALTVGQWSAPIESAYGWHRVRVLTKDETRPSTFEEARGDVLEQYSVFRRQEAIAQYLSQAFSKYRIEVDGRAVLPPTPSRRLALRSLPSGED